MRPEILRDPRRRLALGALAALGAMALLHHWLADRRPDAAHLTARQEFIVTSSADEGPGSLREAIFAADAALGRARIIVQVDAIVLTTPLPPLVNPAGVVLEAAKTGVAIDARAVGTGAIFDIDAANCEVTGIRVANAPNQAFLVRADGFHLHHVVIADSDEGVHVLEGIRNVTVAHSRFENNRIGVQLESAAAGISVRENRFSGHRDAAVWAVQANALDGAKSQSIAVSSNHFEGDRMSLVLGNIPVVIERNEFVTAREVAVFLIGEGAIVRNNRIRGGAGIGVFADGAQGILIEANEVDHNGALGMLVRSSRGALLQRNRFYDNGYGIAFVLNDRNSPNVAVENMLLKQQFDGIIVIGDSPVLRRNVAMNNRAAGLRILTFFPLTGARVNANPFLDGNTLDGNTLNEPAHGEYRVRASEPST